MVSICAYVLSRMRGSSSFGSTSSKNAFAPLSPRNVDNPSYTFPLPPLSLSLSLSPGSAGTRKMSALRSSTRCLLSSLRSSEASSSSRLAVGPMMVGSQRHHQHRVVYRPPREMRERETGRISMYRSCLASSRQVDLGRAGGNRREKPSLLSFACRPLLLLRVRAKITSADRSHRLSLLLHPVNPLSPLAYDPNPPYLPLFPLYLPLTSINPTIPAEKAAEMVMPLPRDIFDAPLRKDILHQCVIQHMILLRTGTSQTPARNQLKGSSKKLHPQKGTGRARVGDRKAPGRTYSVFALPF
jgi:hypothetical protein